MTIEEREEYHGKKFKQVKGTIKVFDEFFKKEKFDNIVEIGSGNGVFSTYIAKRAYDMNASFFTYDIKDIKSHQIKKELDLLDAIVLTLDVNEEDTIDNIIKDKNERCLILNDGGLKVPQLKRFSKILKPNDIIMTHDYYKDREDPATGIIVPKDFKDIYNDLEIIYEDLFDDYIWLCQIKT